MKRTVRAHFAFLKCRFRDNPGLLLLEIVLTGGVWTGDALANVIVLRLVIRSLMRSDYGAVFWTLGCFLLYQIGLDGLYNRFVNEIDPKWREDFYYRQSDRLYRVLLRSDCAVYGDEAYFRTYRKALSFLSEKMEEGIGLHRELLGCFLNGALAVCMYLWTAPGVLALILLSFLGSRFGLERIVEYTRRKQDGQNQKDALHQSWLRTFLSRECAAEGRILGCLPFLNQQDQACFLDKEKQTAGWTRKLLPLRLGKEFFGEFLFLDFLLVACLGYCFFIQESIDMADFAALLNGSHTILYAFSLLFGQMAVALGGQTEYMEAFLAFEDGTAWQENGYPDCADRRKPPGRIRTEQPSPVCDGARDNDESRFWGQIREVCLWGADFSYGERDVLHDITLSVHKGEKVAVVGTSGAGKTTLVRALAGLGRLKNGKLVANGRPVLENRGMQYRRHFTVLFADSGLFATTLGKNVALSEDCVEERARAALGACGLYGEGEEIPVNAQVLRELSDDRLLFSGGQQQKIALARILYQDTDFVIADEAAASLDPFAEDAFNRRVLQENTEKGVILISHRLSVTSMVDRIYVMDCGRIVESGSHRELLERDGIYARMWRRQTGGYVD